MMTKLLPFLLFAAPAWGQSNTASTWAAAGAMVDVGHGWSTGVLQEFRYGVTEQGIEKLTTAAMAGYEAHEHLDLASHYRADVISPETEDHELRHRMGFDATTPWKTGRLQVSLRQRVQPELAPASDDPWQLVLRTRAKACLKYDQVQPYIDVEPYVAVADATEVDRLRFDLGVQLPLEHAKLDLSYRLDEPIADAAEDPHRHIFTVSYVWKAKLKRESVKPEMARVEESAQ